MYMTWHHWHNRHSSASPAPSTPTRLRLAPLSFHPPPVSRPSLSIHSPRPRPSSVHDNACFVSLNENPSIGDAFLEKMKREKQPRKTAGKTTKQERRDKKQQKQGKKEDSQGSDEKQGKATQAQKTRKSREAVRRKEKQRNKHRRAKKQ